MYDLTACIVTYNTNEEVLEKLTIHTVDNIQEVFKIVFGE